MKEIKVGILGYGTVGKGVVEVLTNNALEISRRTGYEIQIKAVARRNWQGVNTDALSFKATTNPEEITQDPEISIVIELMGGIEPAYSLISQALKNKKQVITANKALIAKKGQELFALARENKVNLSFEASVAGGVPVIKVLREGLSANEIQSVAGIINGTCNFILTAMSQKGADFGEVLKEAQELGYAEADPSFDIDGIDAAHKITILASLAYGIPLQFDKVSIEGIREISATDIQTAKELGFVIKHLGMAVRRNNGVEIRVHPALVKEYRMLANVKGVMNAVEIEGNAIGKSLYYGAGAGSLPTASAVVADLIDDLRDIQLNNAAFGYNKPLDHNALPVLEPKDFITANYLRINVYDEVGVLAKITKILAENQISIDSLIQKTELKKDEVIPLIILTNSVKESSLIKAIADIENMDKTVGKVRRIRVEHF